MRIIANASMFKWIQVHETGGKETWDLCGNLWLGHLFLTYFSTPDTPPGAFSPWYHPTEMHSLTYFYTSYSHHGSAWILVNCVKYQEMKVLLCWLGVSLDAFLLLFWSRYLFGTCVIDIEVRMPFAAISRVPVTPVRLLFPCHVMLTKKPTKQGKRENPSNKMPSIKEIIRQ